MGSGVGLGEVVTTMSLGSGEGGCGLGFIVWQIWCLKALDKGRLVGYFLYQSRCHHLYRERSSGAFTMFCSGSQLLSEDGYPFHFIR